MQTESFTRQILKKHGFQNYARLAETVDSIPDKIFALQQLNKQVFKKRLTRLIDQIELEGFVVRESKAMTAPGALFDRMTGDYLEIRRNYIKLRNRLSDKLGILTEMHAKFAYLSNSQNWKTAESL